MRYKKHPIYRDLEISTDGSRARWLKKDKNIHVVEPKPNCPLMIIYLAGTGYSFRRLVLETYTGLAPEGKSYYAITKDGDFKNTNPKNLIWSTNRGPIDPKLYFDSLASRSKLTKEDCLFCHKQFTKNKMTLKQLSAIYGVSDMSIHRAIKRVEKYLLPKPRKKTKR